MILKRIMVALTLIFGLLATDSKACTRTDLEDRTPQEVVAKSLHLAQQGDYSHVTGAVLVRTEKDILSGTDSFARYGTGIALDRYTVLTAAHFLMDEEKASEVLFALHPNPMSSEVDYIGVTGIIPHTTFKHFEKADIAPMTFKIREPYHDAIDPYIGDISIRELTYPKVDQGPLNPLRGFDGIDLAILKLKSPLPENLVFPEIFPQDQAIIDTYGICLGFGRMYYNDQNMGPIRVIDDQRESIMRHLISTKINAYTSINKGPVLYGHYKGLMIKGRYSFIPSPTMLKTEGMPVGGDSGGPQFIKHKGKNKLVGIYSYEWSALGDAKQDTQLEQMLNNCKVTQPIFPVWVDIRTHMSYFHQFMGEMK